MIHKVYINEAAFAEVRPLHRWLTREVGCFLRNRNDQITKQFTNKNHNNDDYWKEFSLKEKDKQPVSRAWVH